MGKRKGGLTESSLAEAERPNGSGRREDLYTVWKKELDKEVISRGRGPRGGKRKTQFAAWGVSGDNGIFSCQAKEGYTF